MQTNIIKKTSTLKFTLKEFFKNLLLAVLITIVFAFVLGYRHLVVVTGSMTPTIPRGSLIVIKKLDYDSIEIGDVITYKSGQSNVTHRVVAIEENTGRPVQASENVWLVNSNQQGFGEVNVKELQKDHNITVGVVTENMYEGTVIYYAHGLGNVMNALSKTSNMIILFVGLVLMVFVISFI